MDIISRIRFLPDELQNIIFFYGIEEKFNVKKSNFKDFFSSTYHPYDDWYAGRCSDKLYYDVVNEHRYRVFIMNKYPK
jgi:hypothetical protein